MLDVRALRAECLFNLTQHEAAARIVNEHMQWEGAERHLPTLIAYTRFAMAYKKVEEPVRAMLTFKFTEIVAISSRVLDA